MRKAASVMKFLLLLLSMSIVAFNTQLAKVQANASPGTVLSFDPLNKTVGPGTVFEVDVVIYDVEDLYGYEFMLFYDNAVLTANDMAPHSGTSNEPGFVFTEYQVWKHEINNDPWGNGTGYAWLAVTLPFGTPSWKAFDGSGTLATIEFNATGSGTTALTFPLHLLGEPNTMAIPHTVVEGLVTVVVPSVYRGDLVKKSAWPGKHHFDQSKDGQYNFLYGKVKNLGNSPVKVRVSFAIYNIAGGLVGTLQTGEYQLAVGEERTLKTDFDTYAFGTGKFKVQAQCWFDSNGDGAIDSSGEKIKSFSFAVVS